MGFDKLLSFFTKNLQNNIVEDLYNKPIVVANHIYFDMNFIVYNSISNIENDINNIYMLIFALPYTDIDRIKKKLSSILDSYYWHEALKSSNINIISILDNKIDEIIKQVKSMIDTYIYDLLYWNVLFTINTSIKNNHPIQFIRSINIFFDGIPTFAKMVEQRRRRMKNYIDSQNRKKIFAQYFNNIINTLVTEDGITFDYFEWLKYLYNFNGPLGPNSDIIIILGDFIIIKLKEEYTGINFTLNNCTINGEADHKIFKHMKDNSIDCNVVIHSCDSDFIFMIIWYQLWCNISGIDINLMMINYNKIHSGLKYEIANTIISGKKINTVLLEKYNIINSVNTDININIIFDLLFILLMFGNDIIPPNYELGTELNLKLLFETHYILYNNSNFVVCLNNINIINFNNLSKWLKAIQLKRSFSIITLNRFYKLPYNFITNVTKKYNIIEMIDNVLIPFHVKQYKKDLIKTKYFNEVDNMDFRSKLQLDDISKLEEIDIYFNEDMNDYINILNSDDYGLIRIERSYEININPYQTLYNNIIVTAANSTEDEFNRPYKIFFNNIKDSIHDYVKLTENCDTNEYLMLLIYTSQIFFYNFDLYTPYSLFTYSDMVAPSIDMILNFIDTNDMNRIQNECYKNISQKEVYFNYISHHLFITPYLLESNYLDSIKDVEHIESLLNVINNCIPGIWYKKNEQFILKKIDPILFIILCNNMIKLYQDNIINNIFKKSSNLLN